LGALAAFGGFAALDGEDVLRADLVFFLFLVAIRDLPRNFPRV
jgi:hypothetical protein